MRVDRVRVIQYTLQQTDKIRARWLASYSYCPTWQYHGRSYQMVAGDLATLSRREYTPVVVGGGRGAAAVGIAATPAC